MMRRAVIVLLLVAATACTPPAIAPAALISATPQQLHANVAAFVQPTQDGRLSALKAQLDAAGLAYTFER